MYVGLKCMALKNIKKEELRKLIKAGKAEIIDVREPEEYNIIHIKGSKLIPINDLFTRLDEINWGREVVFVCRSGARSKMIAKIIAGSGKEISNLEYGLFECFADGKGESLEINQELINNYFG